MRTATYQVDENEILDRIFSFLVESGLENISIRELCRGTDLVQGSLYYWFNDKTAIICEASEYGLHKITDELFAYVFANIGDIRALFDGCLIEIGKYRKELRFIYQMAASPIYGKNFREHRSSFKEMYDQYSAELAELLQCALEELKPLIYLFISAVCDYAVWEDEEKARVELELIYSALPKILTGESIKEGD